MSEDPVIEALCNYVDAMCHAAVSEATGFNTASAVVDMRNQARIQLKKELRAISEQQNRPEPTATELDTIELHPYSPDAGGVRGSANVDAAD